MNNTLTQVLLCWLLQRWSLIRNLRPRGVLPSILPYFLRRAGSVAGLLPRHLLDVLSTQHLWCPSWTSLAPHPHALKMSPSLSLFLCFICYWSAALWFAQKFKFKLYDTYSIFSFFPMASSSPSACESPVLSSFSIPFTRRLIRLSVSPLAKCSHPSPFTQIHFPHSSNPLLPMKRNRNRIVSIPQEEPFSRSGYRFSSRPSQSDPCLYIQPSPTTLLLTKVFHSWNLSAITVFRAFAQVSPA